MAILHTISAFTENSPGVLHRITSIFTRRKINIESLCVSETEKKGISRFTISIRSSEEAVRKIVGQIARIVEVVEVYSHTDDELVFKEIAFYRITVSEGQSRRELEELVHRYGAQIVYGGEDFVVVEKTGIETEVDALYSLLAPFGIVEFVRSGRIAMEKQIGTHPPSSYPS